MTPSDAALRGMRVTVMGLGRFGGGVGVTRFLSARGARVVVTDALSAGELADSVAQVERLPGVTLRLGGHDEADFSGAGLVVVNPAVPPGNAYVAAAERAGVPVTTEVGLLVDRLDRSRVVGITGSAGKSTTTAMLGHALRACGVSAHVGGNLGGSLLPIVDDIGPTDVVVLELSSFMLERLPGWSPGVAVVTNLSPNHLDWHGSMDAYRAAKQRVLSAQRAGDVCVLGDAGRAAGLVPVVDEVPTMDESGTPIELLLPGGHNQANAALAVRAASALGVDAARAAASLASFPGLPHRLAYVVERSGVRWFNDSKATTPEAATLALRAFDAGVAHVILGGADKGSDFAALARVAATHAAAVYTIGATGDTIAGQVEAAGGAAVTRCGDLETAAACAAEATHPGDVVLLSPGCASWDQFAHYAARGERFEALARGSG